MSGIDTRTPVAVVGAGNLISHLHRGPGDSTYRFNVLRSKQGHHSHELTECDLRDLIKLVHVLTFAVLDDGWICQTQRLELRKLISDLEQLTEPVSRTNEIAAPSRDQGAS